MLDTNAVRIQNDSADLLTPPTPTLLQLHKIDVDQKNFFFMWIPGHVDVRGNEVAHRAKEALDKESTDDLMPFSDPLLPNVYIKFGRKKKILPELSDKLFIIL